MRAEYQPAWVVVWGVSLLNATRKEGVEAQWRASKQRERQQTESRTPTRSNGTVDRPGPQDARATAKALPRTRGRIAGAAEA